MCEAEGRGRGGDLPPTDMAVGTWGVRSKPLGMSKYMSAAGRMRLGEPGGPWLEVVKPQCGESRRKPPADLCPEFGISRRIHTWEGKAFLVEGTAQANAWRPKRKQ